MAEITFFAAECMEFPERLGELHENLTLPEAVNVYMWLCGRSKEMREGLPMRNPQRNIGVCEKNRKERQDMETRKPENAQVASVIMEFKEKGCKDDALKLTKEDLELGYPKELVALYAEAGWQMDRCKKFSYIMRGNSDEELLRLLAGGSFNPYQM